MTPDWAVVGHDRRDELPSDITPCVANCIDNALSTAGCPSNDPLSLCSCGASTAVLNAWDCISQGCTLTDYESFSDVLAECRSEGYNCQSKSFNYPYTGLDSAACRCR
ncbi:hypothetical protein FKP32DRAFT_1591992 [Trametes sanguinea]|nr:hypothetical protein FKP32DRAFT_1591992 [Trametes sanguinea]